MGGVYGGELTKGLRTFRPGLNADLNLADGLQGQPVFKLPFEGSPENYKFCLGLASWGLRFFGVLAHPVEYNSSSGKIWTQGIVPARVKAASTAIPGAYLIPVGGATGHFIVSASPSPWRLVTDLSGQTSGTIYGPDNPCDQGTTVIELVPEIMMEPCPAGRISWPSPAALDRDGIGASQTPGGAGNLTIDGAFASGGVATLSPPRCVGIYGAGNEAGKTFTVYGTNMLGEAISEAIAGPNNSTVFTALAYATVTRIAVNAATAGAVEAGTGDKLGLPDAAAARLAEVTILGGTVEGTAVTLANDADEIEKNTADLNSALNGTQVDLLLYER